MTPEAKAEREAIVRMLRNSAKRFGIEYDDTASSATRAAANRATSKALGSFVEAIALELARDVLDDLADSISDGDHLEETSDGLD